MRLHRFSRPVVLAPLALVLLLAPGCRDDAESPTGPGAEPAPGAAVAAVALPTFTAIAAGGTHTCALDTGGAAWCWGDGSDGQLGNGSFNGRSNPVRVTGGHRFIQISTGTRHTCAITTDERAWCWGFPGGLGDGGELVQKNTPVPVAGGRRFRNVSAGNEHTCAVNPFDVAFCWGPNAFGQLGTNGGFTNVPVKVVGGLRWRRVTAGGSVTCGVTTGDVAYCWGWILGGKTPTKVPGGQFFRQVQVGGGDFTDAQHQEPDTPHACGITREDRAYCWGFGFEGQLGQGSRTFEATPVAVKGSRRWRQVNPGHYHTCGVTRAEVAFCWGSNQWGANGNSALGSSEPLRVAGDHEFKSISTGIAGLHSCGLTDAGRVWCWGTNTSGQLGDGTRTMRLEPVAVVGAP
ncbi:MAG TPA: hypothetical protein VJ817_11685 [Gemmatimonadales bacterium]|nr:hypothetical protein [Gemmatimonadales bacterium]